ncbi:Uma2 family endonuclease [Methylorubrum sp. POS3]|uniref:Uma2 family endonuclease n=1 Tax=Methylorubrum sp. POS3 TaxID=2998492 RepID=UPI0037289FDD
MAVAVRRDTRMRVAEYKEWVAARPEGERWELIDGAPVMMAPAKDRHHRIVYNLLRALGDLADPRGCWAQTGLAVLSEAMDDYAPIPDVLVRCGTELPDGYAQDPLLLAEVLSPSTMINDRGFKAAFYQSIPSLRTLLLIYQDEARVEVWRREAEWTMTIAGPGETIALPELGGSLSVADVYARLAV